MIHEEAHRIPGKFQRFEDESAYLGQEYIASTNKQPDGWDASVEQDQEWKEQNQLG